MAPPPALLIESWPLDRPKPYAGNARKLSDRAVRVVAASLKEYGWRQPIVVDRAGVIIAGHTRLLAAQALGLPAVPVHVAAELTPAQAAAYRLMDNRSGDESDWDMALLGTEMVALNLQEFDLSLTGFMASELADILARANGGQTDPDEVPEPPADPVAKAGDLWLLGGHRLLCGDSASLAAVALLMDGQKADLVFTDPPYNVDYDPEARPNGPTSKERKARPLGKIKNDKKSPADFRAFLDAVYSVIDASLKPGHAIYICHADTEGHHFRNAFIAQPWKLQSCLIWVKTVLVFGRSDYHWKHEPLLYGWKEGDDQSHTWHEPILYGWKEGEAHVWHGNRKQTTVIEVATDHVARSSSDTAGVYVHPTQKPVALIEKAITNSSVGQEVVLDLFGGSGSTVIACQKMGRLARVMELERRFVDVIIVRWQNFTGQEATLASDGRTFAAHKAERLQQ